MPNTPANVVGARPGAQLCGVTADNLVPLVLLKVPDTLGEEASSNEVQEAGRNDEEELNGCGFGAPEWGVSTGIIMARIVTRQTHL